MEKCKFSSKRLSFYIDGQLSYRAKRRVEKHLSACKRCQQEMILLRTARLALKSFSDVKPPDSMDRDFIHRLQQEKLYHKK